MHKKRYVILIIILATYTGHSTIIGLFTQGSSFFLKINQQELIKNKLDDDFMAATLPSLSSPGQFSSILSTNNSSDALRYDPHLIIQEEVATVLLNETGTKNDDFIKFSQNIWSEELGSDLAAVSNPSWYQSGTIVSTDVSDLNNTLFIRIGNKVPQDGGEWLFDEADQTLHPQIKSGLSAGWNISFPIQNDYSHINVSFKWRYDAVDLAFDNYTKLPNGVVLDSTSDYQEIRARINHPVDPNKSFWLEAPITNKNPNGTVFYRVGPNVILDEQWFTFSASFYVPPETNNYTLQLGAYLNTREYWNEYFDVWFDDILIQGLDNVTDTYPPIPANCGLARTDIVEENKFWANFSEGKWASQIKNVTVFYNRTGDVLNNTNIEEALIFDPSDFIDNAGYNRTHWYYYMNFSFDDTIDYYFLIYDKANNSYSTSIRNEFIRDNDAPRIISSTNIQDTNFVYEMGNGTIIIRIDTDDFGDATSDVILQYEIYEFLENLTKLVLQDGTEKMHQNGTQYYLRLIVPYNKQVDFTIQLNDSVGNSRIYPDYSISATKDNIAPTIENITIIPSTEQEGETSVQVKASDAYGEIYRVNLVVISVDNNEIGGKGAEFFNKTLVYNNDLDIWELSQPLSLTYQENLNYSFTAVVQDYAEPVRHITNYTIYYTVVDTIAPKIKLIEEIYPFPGIIQVQVNAEDLGSGIDEVMLELRTESGWVPFEVKSQRGNVYFFEIYTDWFGNEQIEYRIKAIDIVGNPTFSSIRPYTTPLFVTTIIGLLATESIVVAVFIIFFTLIKAVQRRRVRIVRRKRFDLALDRSERLAYIGEEAVFGFVAAYSSSEETSSILIWEPRLVGNFYQYFKELAEKANSAVNFIMQTRPQKFVTYVDFNIEEISCSAVTFAYPMPSIPTRWLSSVTLDTFPTEGTQGVLLLMLLMRDKWSEIVNNFQDEISDGIQEIKELLVSEEEKEVILQKIREFRLFISGTIEVLEEIETETDEISDEIMADFESEFTSSSLDDEDETQDQ